MVCASRRIITKRHALDALIPRIIFLMRVLDGQHSLDHPLIVQRGPAAHPIPGKHKFHDDVWVNAMPEQVAGIAVRAGTNPKDIITAAVQTALTANDDCCVFSRRLFDKTEKPCRILRMQPDAPVRNGTTKPLDLGCAMNRIATQKED